MYVDDIVKKEAYRRRLSLKTTKAYLYWIHRFLKYTKKDHKSLTKKDVRLFIEHLSGKDLSGNTLNIALAAVNFFVEWVLNKRWKLYIKYSKVPKELPAVLNKKEIIRILDVIKNKKTQADDDPDVLCRIKSG
jgi:site-specific recombinase XerD